MTATKRHTCEAEVFDSGGYRLVRCGRLAKYSEQAPDRTAGTLRWYCGFCAPSKIAARRAVRAAAAAPRREQQARERRIRDAAPELLAALEATTMYLAIQDLRCNHAAHICWCGEKQAITDGQAAIQKARGTAETGAGQ
jgi:hypothetical protein